MKSITETKKSSATIPPSTQESAKAPESEVRVAAPRGRQHKEIRYLLDHLRIARANVHEMLNMMPAIDDHDDPACLPELQRQLATHECAHLVYDNLLAVENTLAELEIDEATELLLMPRVEALR